MSNVIEKTVAGHRPAGPPGRGDKYLADHALELRRVLSKAQTGAAETALCLPERALADLAVLLVEFAEDVHNDLGLWRSVEQSNRELFGTPLPMILPADDPQPLADFDARRLQFVLWGVWEVFQSAAYLSPRHPHLRTLAVAASQYLAEKFARVPADSGIARLLRGPTQFGWEIKNQLFWLGVKAYLFRPWFSLYLRGQDERSRPVPLIDDFICSQCTPWSGLGAIDVLALALDLSAEDRRTLRSWYERHAAIYRVLDCQTTGETLDSMKVLNLINHQEYFVRVGMKNCPLKSQMTLFGSLVPWHGEWYWSGEQNSFEGDFTAQQQADLRQKFLAGPTCGMAYRYCPDLLELACTATRRMQEKFIGLHGGDLSVFGTGKEAVAALQQAIPETLNVPVDLPKGFSECSDGVAAFFNPEEGVEFMAGFHPLVAGLQKKGADLNEDDKRILREFMSTLTVSPAFVNRVVRDHGTASLLAAHGLQDESPELALPYLLRSYKGPFYRRRYPQIMLGEAAKNAGPSA